MSTNPFSDEEVEQILKIIKTKPQYHTTSEKEKLMIHVDIARQLSARPNGVRRSALQVRYKILILQKGYKKLKANPTHLSAVHQQTVRYYELLNEIFGGRSPEKKKTEKVTSLNLINDETIKEEPNHSLVYNSFIIKEEVENEAKYDIPIENKHDQVKRKEEFVDYSFKVTQTTEKTHLIDKPAENLSIEEESPDFKIMKQCFSDEVKESQRDLVEAIKEQDKLYMHANKNNCKYQEIILKRDRQEIDRILENDRKEMVTIFKSVLNAMGKTFSYETHTVDSEEFSNNEENEDMTESEEID